MFQNNYYYLVAGLREFSLGGDVKGFDAPAMIEEIKEGISKRDRRTVELLYTYYDIENIVNMRAGREQFSVLGNFSREELAEELESPSRLPKYLGKVITEYNMVASQDPELDPDNMELDINASLERNLFAAYYAECAKSGSRFMREWADFDRTLRNIAAGFAARRMGVAPVDVIVGSGEIETALSRSSAADFGIRGEISYIDQITGAVVDSSNLVDKETKVDAIRWDMAVELTSMDDFNVNFLLGYLVKINIIYRWVALDADKGREMLRKLIDQLTESDPVQFQPEA